MLQSIQNCQFVIEQSAKFLLANDKSNYGNHDNALHFVSKPVDFHELVSFFSIYNK